MQLEELQRIIEKEWEVVPMELLQRLVDSMRRRLAAVKSNGGGSTLY